MASRLAAIRGVPVSQARATDILKDFAGVVSLGFLAQQIAIGGYKTFLPGWGVFITIPLVFSLTYAIGEVLDYYFIRKAKGQQASPEDLRRIFKQAMKKGNALGKRERKKIERSKL